jgi:multiple sugar transport system substrate-binding protein
MHARSPRTGRRAFAAIGLAVSLAAALTACGGSQQNANGTQTLTFWDDNAGPGVTPVWQHLIGEFEKQNPKINVNYVGVPIANIQQKYNTAIAGGATPDVGAITDSLLAGIIAQNALVPLDQQFDSSPLKNQLTPSVVKLVRDSAPDGKLYNVPFTTNYEVLYYRKDLFKQAGLPVPKTLDEMFADAVKLTHGSQYGFALRGGPGSMKDVTSLMYSYSGLSDFFDSSGKNTVNDPANVAFAKKYAALYKKATSSADLTNGYQQEIAEFDSGKTAMITHDLGSYNDHAKALGSKLGVALVPKAVDGSTTMVTQAPEGLSVFKNSSHQAAAWKFVEFINSASADGYWNQHTSQLPTNSAVRNESWAKSNPAVSQVLAALADPKTRIVAPPYYLPQWGAITKTNMEPLWQKVLLKQETPQAFADELAKQLTAAQQDWVAHEKK